MNKTVIFFSIIFFLGFCVFSAVPQSALASVTAQVTYYPDRIHIEYDNIQSSDVGADADFVNGMHVSLSNGVPDSISSYIDTLTPASGNPCPIVVTQGAVGHDATPDPAVYPLSFYTDLTPSCTGLDFHTPTYQLDVYVNDSQNGDNHPFDYFNAFDSFPSPPPSVPAGAAFAGLAGIGLLSAVGAGWAKMMKR